ncbi:MAG: DUF1828 domain-containing protein [Roseiarcus sp.]
MKEAICKAFCNEIRIREVPVGLAVSTAFRRADGDAIGFYVVRNPSEPGLAHLEDDGLTVPYLEAAGVDLETQTRKKAFDQILSEYGAQYDSEEAVVRTPDVPESEIARLAISFTALLLRLFDFLLLSQDYAASAFRDDAIKRIRDAIGDRAEIEEDEVVDGNLSDVRADLVIRGHDRNPVAVFLAQSPQRLNDAIFLQMAALYEAHRNISVVALLQRDSSASAKLKQRAANRLSAVPVYEGEEDQAISRIVREAVGFEAVLH